MKRATDVVAFWDLLPTFRVVAEHQHLSHAAAELDVTPAAVSRKIARLEASVGAKLFERVPRGMQLTTAGAALLAPVREAMRRIDDVRVSFEVEQPRDSEILLAFDGNEIGLLLHQALSVLKHPRQRLTVTNLPSSKAAAALLAGDIDIAITPSPSSDDRILCRHIGQVPCRWVTLHKSTALPPDSAGKASWQLPPAVAPLSSLVLASIAVRAPRVVPMPAAARQTGAEPISLWRLTRTRPTRSLVAVAKKIADLASG